MAGLGTGGGGSGGANAIRAGNAYVEMGVKDKTGPDLAKISKSLASFGKGANEELQKKLSGKEIGKKFSEGFLVGFLGGSVLSAIKSVASEIGRSVTGMESATDLGNQLSRHLEKSADQADKLAKKFDFMRGDAMPGDMFGLNADELKQQTRQLERLRGEWAEAKNVSERADDISLPRRFGLSVLSFTGAAPSAAEIKEMAEKGKHELEKQMTVSERRIQELERSSRRIRDPFSNPAFKKQIEDVQQEWDDALDDRIAGMGQYEKMILKVQRTQAGADAEAIKKLDEIREKAAAADAELKKKSFVGDMDKALREADPFWMAQIGDKRGEFEKRLLEQFPKLAIDSPLWDRARNADKKIKELGLEKDFMGATRAARFKRTTQGLSPEDAELAGLVDKGWTDAKILELRRLQGINGPGLDLDRLKEIRADLNPQFVSGLKEQLALAAGEAARTAGSAGTFSAMQAGQLGRIDAIPKQQLEELKDANDTLVKLETIFTQVRMGLALR
jgi:hypothetical protein